MRCYKDRLGKKSWPETRRPLSHKTRSRDVQSAVKTLRNIYYFIRVKWRVRVTYQSAYIQGVGVIVADSVG